MTTKAEAMKMLLKELEGVEMPIYMRAMLTVLLEQNSDIDERLQRVESMLAYQMGSTERQVQKRPTTTEARQLSAMGLPPWPRLVRVTNDFELWREGWDAQARAMAQKLEDLKALEREAQQEEDRPEAPSDQAHQQADAPKGAAQN